MRISTQKDQTALVFDGGTPVTAAVAQALTETGARVVTVAGTAPPDTVTVANVVIIGNAPAVGRGLCNLTPDNFRAVETAHIVRPWLILKQTLPLLKAAPAAIVMVLPGAGLKPGPGRVFDCAAYGALQSMFRSMALECGRDHPHVRVNAVVGHDEHPANIVTASVIHLISPDAGFMTGAIIGAP